MTSTVIVKAPKDHDVEVTTATYATATVYTTVTVVKRATEQTFYVYANVEVSRIREL